LSVQSTCALMCVGAWSLMGYVKDNDIKAVAVLPEVEGDEDELEEAGITLNSSIVVLEAAKKLYPCHVPRGY
ncbi:hypothetical protein L208DRAFT_1270491, partial [Tricholoma matsutake]